MQKLKSGLKVSLLSALILAGSLSTPVRADHERDSIVPLLAAGVFASLLFKHSYDYEYRYEKKYRHNRKHLRSHNRHRRHSHSHDGYRYQVGRHHRH